MDQHVRLLRQGRLQGVRIFSQVLVPGVVGPAIGKKVLDKLFTTPKNPEEIVKEICEVDDYLKEQKGFGSLGTGSTGRLMYAALLVMDNYMPETTVMENAVVGSALAAVIAQQMAMICIMTAATTSAAVNN